MGQSRFTTKNTKGTKEKAKTHGMTQSRPHSEEKMKPPTDADGRRCGIRCDPLIDHQAHFDRLCQSHPFFAQSIDRRVSASIGGFLSFSVWR
jgi:hypothetical protein